MPAFTKPVSQSMPGFGSPSYYGTVYSVAATGSAQAIAIAGGYTTPAANGTPFLLDGGPPPSRGKVRVRSNSLGGTFTLTSIVVSDSVGNSAQIAGPSAAAASAQNIDETYEFNTDLNITLVTFNVAASSAVGTIDCEVSLV